MKGFWRDAAVRNFVAHACAVIVGGYFLYAAYGKILDPRQFAIDIKNYQIMPEPLLNLPALFMPWWEVAAAIAFIVPKTRRAGAIIISGMLLLFIGMIGYSAIYKGLDISCGCTGKHSSKAGWFSIIRNLLLLAATFGSVYLYSVRTRLATGRCLVGMQAQPAEQPA